MNSLELIGLRKVFKSDLLKKKQVAVDNLTCRFTTGLCTGLLGHNGAGKTTAIRLILGLSFPDAGKILFEGKPITTKSKRFIGYMPEVNKLPAALTPDEILMQQIRLFRPGEFRNSASIKKRIDEQLEAVGLTLHRKKRIGQMSKGMARRLAWAQAIIHQPKLLILDEPSSGLDPLGRQKMMSWIRGEKDRGTTILLCTHELAQIQTLCDELHIMRRGKLVFSTSRTPHTDAVAETASPRGEWRQRYSLQISGADEAALMQLGIAAGLNPWASLKKEGYLSILSFDHYEDGASWLKSCLNKGYVVIRFSDEALLGEAELLTYFAND